jgi:hypothetical protein
LMDGESTINMMFLINKSSLLNPHSSIHRVPRMQSGTKWKTSLEVQLKQYLAKVCAATLKLWVTL